MGPRPPLRCRATPGEGASLTSSMRLLSAIKAQLMGAVVTGGPGVTKQPLWRGIRRQVYYLREEGCWGWRARLMTGQSPPPPASGRPPSTSRWSQVGDGSKASALCPWPCGDMPTSRPTAEARTGHPPSSPIRQSVPLPLPFLTPGLTAWAQIPALPLSGCVTFGRPLHLTGLQRPHL